MNRNITIGITNVIILLIILNFSRLHAQFYIALEDTQNGQYLSSSVEQYRSAYDWVNDQRSDYTYDGNWLCTEVLESEWNGMAWENDKKLFFFYDSNGNDTLELAQRWTGNEWRNTSKERYIYNEEGLNMEELEYDWINYSAPNSGHK